MSELGEGEHCGRRDAEPERAGQSPTGSRHKQRGILSPIWAPPPQLCGARSAGLPVSPSRPLGLRHRPPPDPCQSTATSPFSTWGAFRKGHSPGRLQLTRGQLEGAGLGAEGMHRRAENRLPCKQHPETSEEWGGKGDQRAKSRERRSGRREEGFPSSLLLSTSSRAGSSPRGGAWQGTALLCDAGPVGSAPRRPPSWQRVQPFN